MTCRIYRNMRFFGIFDIPIYRKKDTFYGIMLYVKSKGFNSKKRMGINFQFHLILFLYPAALEKKQKHRFLLQAHKR